MKLDGLKFENKEYYAWWLLVSAFRLMSKARSRELLKHGITPEQAAVSHILYFDSNVTPSEIARRLLLEPHSVSALVTRMEQSGLVTKIKDLDRKNKVRVVLTKKGQDLYRDSHRRESICEIIDVLSNKEQDQLINALYKLVNNVLGLEIGEPLIKKHVRNSGNKTTSEEE